jgi:ketosteroid isomerase-like protein
MSSEQRNEQLVREGTDAFNRGDLGALVRLFDEKIESHVAPGLANPGTWHGHGGFAEMVATWGEAFESQLNTIVSMHHPDEHHVIAEIHQAAVGAGSGAPVEMTLYYLFEIRDGRGVRLQLHADYDSALAAVH